MRFTINNLFVHLPFNLREPVFTFPSFKRIINQIIRSQPLQGSCADMQHIRHFLAVQPNIFLHIRSISLSENIFRNLFNFGNQTLISGGFHRNNFHNLLFLNMPQSSSNRTGAFANLLPTWHNFFYVRIENQINRAGR